jgi:CubicO group peptidase (beta-lactamase class C family)
MKLNIASSVFRSVPSYRRALGRGVGLPLLSLALTLGTITHGTAQITDRQALVAALDSASRAHAAQPMVPGISVAVVRGADTLLMRGYGKVDLEWDVATPADAGASYEIGSMTKQFTAAALLQLAEDGKVDLDADLTAYLPDYDTQGRRIPVRRLLDHTSGIKGYTEMPVFGDLRMQRLPRDTLVSLVQAEPLEFEPGTALIYNNSAYFLLGLIIEKVSGQSYEEYVAEHLFQPLGMEGSYYCSERAIRERRAHGYDGTPQGLERAAYLDHTWPYAAGSLCSTVRDLVRWNQGLHGGRLLSENTYRTLITPAPLGDGTPTRYAGGLGVMGEGRHRTLAHGGGINGFTSDGRYYPQDELTVVVLQNSTGSPGPGALSAALSNLVLGASPALEGTPYTGSLDELTGRYTGPARGRPLTMVVTREGDALVFTPEGSTNAVRPVHLGNLTWGMGDIRIRFVREGEAVTRLVVDQGAGIFVLAREGESEG